MTFLSNKLNKLLMEWVELRGKFDEFDIDEDDYENWKSNFPKDDTNKNTYRLPRWA